MVMVRGGKPTASMAKSVVRARHQAKTRREDKGEASHGWFVLSAC